MEWVNLGLGGVIICNEIKVEILVLPSRRWITTHYFSSG